MTDLQFDDVFKLLAIWQFEHSFEIYDSVLFLNNMSLRSITNGITMGNLSYSNHQLVLDLNLSTKTRMITLAKIITMCCINRVVIIKDVYIPLVKIFFETSGDLSAWEHLVMPIIQSSTDDSVKALLR